MPLLSRRWWTVLACVASASPAGAQARRAMVPEDLLRLRMIWETSLSPDGARLAVVADRDLTMPTAYLGRAPIARIPQDVWIISAATGARTNLTEGDRDASTTWRPVWSPNGQRLAMLTTKGGTDRIRLLVWSDGEARAVVMDDGPVYHRTKARLDGVGTGTPVLWLNDDELLYVAVPEGFDESAMQRLPRAWRAAASGTESTVSVLESGAAVRPSLLRSTLRRLHVPSGRTTVIAEIPPEPERQTDLLVALAPTRTHVAVVGDIGPNHVPATTPISADNERRTRVAVVPLSGAPGGPVTWVPGVAGPKAASLRWSRDGRHIAVVAKRGGGDDVPDPAAASTIVFVIGIDGTVRSVAPDTLTASAVEWTRDGTLLVRASLTGTTGKAARADWWRIDVTTGARTVLTEQGMGLSGALVRMGDGRLVGVADSMLYVLDPRRGVRPLVAASSAPIRGIVWPRPGGAAVEALVVEAGDRERPVLSRADLRGNRVWLTRIELPHPGARLVDFRAVQELVTFSGSTDAGTFVWMRRGDESWYRTVFTANEFIADVEPAPRKLVTYRGADGDSLSAALLLPPGYREGTRVPVVVWMYGGMTVRDTLFADSKDRRWIFSGQLFAARGYAVLYPSIPLEPYGSRGEPMVAIAKGVLPAVDRLVELGIADPTRIAVGGVSYGAYSVYALLTQTSRFRAAIAANGDANLFTSYAKFDADERYLESAHETREGAWWSEASQGRMGMHPWHDPMRYLRNSPFFALDRIETPLLIVHSDLDFIPIAHAEQMFAGLYRLGKTSRFVRYFGERHVVQSPPNVRDLWRQMYRWLDKYLAPRTPERPHTVAAD